MQKRNPYKVLGVKPTDDMKTIREKFKKLVMITHPDKGGSAELFGIVKNAYSYIFNLRKKQAAQLKKENQTLDKLTTSRDLQDEKIGGPKDIRNNVLSTEVKSEFGRKKVVFSKKNFDSNQFNNLFTEYKSNAPDDPNARGYGNPYENGGKRLSDEQIRQIKREEEEDRELAIYKDPEPVDLDTSMQYKDIGIDKVDSFGKRVGRKGAGYSDYKQAYTQYKSINTMGNVRTKEYKNMSDYKNSRGKQNVDTSMSKDYFNMKEEEEHSMNALRNLRISQQDDETEKAYNTLNRMISFK